MADEEIKRAEGEVPEAEAGAEDKKPKEKPVIHVIPDEFYGAALKSRVKVSIPKDEREAKEKGKKPGKAKAENKLDDGQKKPRKGPNPILLIVLGIFLLAALSGGGYYYFFVMKKDSGSVTPVEPPPVEDVCGNGVCKGNETEDNCAADCKPAAECGDGTCQEDEGEDSDSCAEDCGPPPPECGNDICEAPETFEACPADCQPPEPVPSLDTDSDGLSDFEEDNIYRTNAYNPDTDNDSYVDLNELLNLFNPALPQPSSLPDNPGVATYSNADIGYEILYPSAWTVSEGEDAMSTDLLATRGESVKIRIEAKATEDASLMDWYLEQEPLVRSSEVQVFRSKQGHDQILSRDQRTAYLEVNGYFFTISYDLGGQEEIRYQATFKMMINSLKYQP